jgi:hypothetical protein
MNILELGSNIKRVVREYEIKLDYYTIYTHKLSKTRHIYIYISGCYNVIYLYITYYKYIQ